MRPRCSASAVVAADSHPERESLFLLAFADGTAAVIDATHFFHRHGKGEPRARAANSGTGGETAFIKGLHAIGTSPGGARKGEIWAFDDYESSASAAGIGARASGITAVAFVPGRKAVAITVGADGKCCIVDFTQSTPDKAVLMKTWHLRRPATSLSILCYAQKPVQSYTIPRGAPREESDGRYCVAVGSEDGRTLLFDLDGTPLGDQALDGKGAPVIDVEWTTTGHSDDSHRSPNKGQSAIPPTRQTLADSGLSHDHLQQAEILSLSSMLVELENELPFDSSTPRKAHGVLPMEIVSGGVAFVTDEVLQAAHASVELLGRSDTTVGRMQDSQLASAGNPGTPPQRSPALRSLANQAGITSRFSPPAVPPRPTPKPGGKLFMRRAQSSPWAPPEVLTSSSSNSRRSGLIFGPRRQPNLENQVPSTFSPSSSDKSMSTAQNQKGVSDVAPAPPQHEVMMTPTSSTDGPKSFKTASSQGQSSEASTDTVVNWSTPLSRIPAPSFLSSPQRDASPTLIKTRKTGHVGLSPFSTPRGRSISDSLTSNRNTDVTSQKLAINDTVVDWSAGMRKLPMPFSQPTKENHTSPIATKPRQKGHISLSVSSISRETGSPIFSQSDELFNVVDQWPVDSSQESIPAVRLIRPSGEVPVNTTSQQRGHFSLPGSSTTTNTLGTTTTGSENPVVEWPSLKKSPRIGELNRISSPSKYEPSATMTVFETYSVPSPSPQKISRRPTLNSPEVLEHPSQVSKHSRPLIAADNPAPSPPHLHECNCANIIASTLQGSLAVLRVDMGQQIEALKSWFEDLVKDGQEERLMLAEENGLLRAKLARSERSKGKKWSPREL